jgi:SAM-dependent methyltransferase
MRALPHSPVAEPQRIAAHVAAVAREIARSTPPPRDHPFFGLDAINPLPIAALERLAAAGIFRKYELVLELGTGLGATARWLARTRGCRVVGIATTAAEAIAARGLTLRCRLDEQVHAVAAGRDALPLRGEAFTHVWCIEHLLTTPAPQRPRVLRAAFETLRAGGYFVAQETVRVGPRRAARHDPPGRGDPLASVPTVEEHIAMLATAGFADVRVDDVTALSSDIHDPFDGPRAMLAARIAAHEGTDCEHLLTERRYAALAVARRSGDLRTVQLVASRPATPRPS